MHPPLHRSHPYCQLLIDLLEGCHKENPRMKFFGVCNDAKIGLDRCFKFEKQRKRKMNFLKSRRDFEGIEKMKAENSELRKKASEPEWLERFVPQR
eukprot:g2516.t1